MTSQDKFIALTRKGEDTRIEYKTCTEEISESLYESVCSLLNPTRLLPEIPEGELTIQQLSNYTKNPLLTRVFHELHWAEDLGSGTRNILRYAPLYYPNYKVEINSGSQFIFSITYQEVNVQDGDKNVPENVTKTRKMSQRQEKCPRQNP